MGVSGLPRANNVRVGKGLSGGSKPRNRGRVRRPAGARREQGPGETVGGFNRVETRGYLSRGEDSEGESQERRRRETKPAGMRREETVERVTKPWGRNVAGRQRPRQVDLRILMCCRDWKPMRGACFRLASRRRGRELGRVG
jgi:hypothetical protein